MTREEAIEVYNGLINTKIKEAFEFFAPELRESEDERIRKELVSLVKEGGCITSKKDIELALAYLEKQKEPIDPFDTKLFQDGVKEGRRLEREDIKKEPIPIPDKFCGLQSLLLQYLQSAANRTNDTEIESDTDLFGRKILDYVWKYDDKQKEQGHTCDSAQFEEGFKTGLEFGLRKKKEQKPVEWSEEDEKQIRQIERIVKNAGCTSKLQEKIHNWLNSLRPVKQEWSEEDERILKGIIGLIDHDQHYGVSNNEMISWLKSLRPYWKPSEEQMGALNYAYCELFKRKDVSHNVLGPLQNLIDTLRKL